MRARTHLRDEGVVRVRVSARVPLPLTPGFGTSLMRVLSELRPRTPSGPGMCLMGSVLAPG